jgi:hypothetical protein
VASLLGATRASLLELLPLTTISLLVTGCLLTAAVLLKGRSKRLEDDGSVLAPRASPGDRGYIENQEDGDD